MIQQHFFTLFAKRGEQLYNAVHLGQWSVVPDDLLQIVFFCNYAMDDIAAAINNKDNTITINQLPVSAARWQHGSQICFATFIN